jgi:soluble lytic murein transglycosylase-like protein
MLLRRSPRPGWLEVGSANGTGTVTCTLVGDMDASRTPTASAIRRRRLVAAGLLAVVLIGVAVVARSLIAESASASVLVPRTDLPTSDPLAYEDGQADDLERAASFGLSHPLYAKSPGGVLATAKRTAAFRGLVEEAVSGSELDADIVEAIVFLESAGRPDVIAGDDPARASGLTQILAETAQNFLGMRVDLARSRVLTAQIRAAVERGDKAQADRLRAERRRIDARFDPEQALAGTVRYLAEAHDRLGREDLAVVSYHMGIGNLTNVLRAYSENGSDLSVPELVEAGDLSWVRVFFDTTPVHHAAAHELLSRLGDDSPTYYWRVLAAREIMRLYREDPERLAELDLLHSAKGSAEEVLHPPSQTERFADGQDLERAWDENVLQVVPDEPERLWFTLDRAFGELASRLGRPRDLYRGLRPEALALLVYMTSRVHELSGATQPLRLTSAVRDEEYQALLRASNPEATTRYSLHTTGYAFDIRRDYESAAQARAFQFVLDDLTARGLITWVREPQAIHVTVAPEAESLVPTMLEPAR